MRILGLLLILLSANLANTQGIEFFHGEWKEAVEEAKKQDKLLFVDAYAKWCGPCKRMAKNVFTNEEVGKFYNAKFINLKLDMETADGRSFGSKFPVSAYPTLLFIDGNGELVKKVTGGLQVEQFLALGAGAIKGHDKSGQYEALYNEGKRDFDLMVNYVSELNKVGKPSLKISNEYINSQPKISLQQKAEFLMAAVTESDSKLFDALVALKSTAEKLELKTTYKSVIENAAMKTVAKSIEYDYPELYDEAISNYKRAGVGNDKEFEMKAKMKYHKLDGDWEAWKKVSEKYLKKYGKKDPTLYKEHLTIISRVFSYKTEANDYACDVCKEMIKKEDSTANYESYIQTLLDCKKFEEARKITKEAIKKAKKKEEDIAQLERILKYLDKV